MTLSPRGLDIYASSLAMIARASTPLESAKRAEQRALTCAYAATQMRHDPEAVQDFHTIAELLRQKASELLDEAARRHVEEAA